MLSGEAGQKVVDKGKRKTELSMPPFSRALVSRHQESTEEGLCISRAFVAPNHLGSRRYTGLSLHGFPKNMRDTSSDRVFFGAFPDSSPPPPKKKKKKERKDFPCEHAGANSSKNSGTLPLPGCVSELSRPPPPPPPKKKRTRNARFFPWMHSRATSSKS